MPSRAVEVDYAIGPRMLLRSGAWLDLLDPGACAFDIEDVAHGSARICRYAGQRRDFYSVAEHSLLVGRACPTAPFAGPMHDAAEALIGDVTRPLKQLLPDYRSVERGVEEQLLATFGEEVLADRVKQMIGHMVRQIMEQRGWTLDQSEVRIRSVPFVKASRYKRPEWATFHAFRNAKDPCDVAITDRRHEPKLPAGERWVYYVTFASPLKASVGFGVNDFRQLERDVREMGWRRVRVERMLRRA